MTTSLGTARFKPWVRLVQVAVILAVGGMLLASGISGYRAGAARGTPVSVPDEERLIADAQKLLADDDAANDAGAAAQIRSARDRIAEEKRRQAALAGRGRSILFIVVGSLGYAVLVFEAVRLGVLIRRRRRAAGDGS